MLVGELSKGDTATSMSLSSAARAEGALEDGFHDIPDWRSIVEGVRAPRPQDRPEGDEPRHRWQAKAHQFREKRSLTGSWPLLALPIGLSFCPRPARPLQGGFAVLR